jgi:hypothetical protein
LNYWGSRDWTHQLAIALALKPLTFPLQAFSFVFQTLTLSAYLAAIVPIGRIVVSTRVRIVRIRTVTVLIIEGNTSGHRANCHNKA